MPSVYADPVVRGRLIEFLGGDTLDHATAVYIAQSDGCQYDRAMLRRPGELDHFLTSELDIARSLADSTSVLFHLDMEYVNFDSPEEAYLNSARAFDLQEPTVKVIINLLHQWGIRPLHLITGQGHHFVWRIARESGLASRIATLCPAPELLDACEQRVPPAFSAAVDRDAHRAFAGLSLLMEYVAHRVKELATPLSQVPVEITAVHVGLCPTKQREIISIDISEYGDPIHTRMVRIPFTNYLKPWVNGLASSPGLEGKISPFRAIPLHEMDIEQALKVHRGGNEGRESILQSRQKQCARTSQGRRGHPKANNRLRGAEI